MNKYDIISAIQEHKARPAWGSGVKQIALDMLNQTCAPEITSAKDALNGAESPRQWVESGRGLTRDEDIAALLCTPSELRLFNGGKRPPVGFKSWSDVYVQAAIHAYELLRYLCGESDSRQTLEIFVF